LSGQEDWTYGGYGNNWKAMLAVLQQKFSPGSPLAEKLKQTGDAFLLEHNAVSGRDQVWSDNCDGFGTNWLGLQLMLVRDTLTGRSAWTTFILSQVDSETGSPKGLAWPSAVQNSTRALITALASAPSGPLCATPGCGKPTWNGQLGGKCSRSCGAGVAVLATGGYGPLCISPGCSKPTYNGKSGERCSRSCGTGTVAGTHGHVCATHGCSKPAWNGQAGEKCTRSCTQVALALPAIAPATCITHGCSKPTFNGKPGGKCTRSCGSRARM
jgi:hypothetical protein